MVIKVVHGVHILTKGSLFDTITFVYRNTTKKIENLPNKLISLLGKKYTKFKEDLMIKKKPLEFTFGYDDESGVSAIAIVHPKDYFSRKIGYNIVKGRIERVNEGKPYFRVDKNGYRLMDSEGFDIEYIPVYIEVEVSV